MLAELDPTQPNTLKFGDVKRLKFTHTARVKCHFMRDEFPELVENQSVPEELLPDDEVFVLEDDDHAARDRNWIKAVVGRKIVQYADSCGFGLNGESWVRF